MSLKNVLIVVDNIDESIDFYEELFGLRVITRLEGNVIMSEGLVLQDVDVWYDSTKIHTTRRIMVSLLWHLGKVHMLFTNPVSGTRMRT